MTVRVYTGGKPPKLKETICNVIDIKDNEHSFTVITRTRGRDRRMHISKHIFSKPEFACEVTEEE